MSVTNRSQVNTLKLLRPGLPVRVRPGRHSKLPERQGVVLSNDRYGATVEFPDGSHSFVYSYDIILLDGLGLFAEEATS